MNMISRCIGNNITCAKCFSGVSMQQITTVKRDSKSPSPQLLMSCQQKPPFPKAKQRELQERS